MRFVFESLDLVERVWHKFIYVPFMRIQLAKHGTHVNIGKDSENMEERVILEIMFPLEQTAFVIYAGKGDYR